MLFSQSMFVPSSELSAPFQPKMTVHMMDTATEEQTYGMK